MHIFEHGSYILLKKYFSNHHSYVPNFQVISDIAYRMYLGLYLDVHLGSNGKPRFEDFTMENYFKWLATYKAYDYGVYFPMALGMHMADCYDPDMHQEAKWIFKFVDEMLMIEVNKASAQKQKCFKNNFSE